MAEYKVVNAEQLDAELTNLANKIREKSGTTEELDFYEGDFTKAVNMIESGRAEEKLKVSEYPDYVRTEATRVAAEVRKFLKDDSIVSIKISDTHYVGDTATTADNFQSDISNIHACMAIKALTYLLPVDYIAHLGDVGAGTVMQNNDAHKKELTDYLQYFREAVGNIPTFVSIGNHDTAIYYHKGQTDGNIHTLPGDWLYDNFTLPFSESGDVIAGESVGGYFYRDFEDKKLRVFLLNTSERLITEQIDKGLSETQKIWVAKALKELNTKSDASSWGFVVLCHYALDYGEVHQASQIFKDYLDGESYTANGETVNFNGCNNAKFYAQFHGHWHCFKSDNLHADMNWQDNGGTLYPYTVWRLCTPNANYNAENTYKDKIIYGVSFGEDTSFPKTPDSAKDTSFVVDVINPSESKIYSFYYGVGYDRDINMNETAIKRYGVTKIIDFTQVEVTNESGVMIEEGGDYTATIAPREDNTIESVTVTMGGVDITSTAYTEATGAININNVNGTIVITVISKGAPINLVKLATTADGEALFGEDYNGDGIADGYQKGMYLSTTSPGYSTNEEYADAVTSGWIEIKPYAKTITIKNVSTTEVYFGKAKIMGYSERRHGGIMVTVTFDQSKAPNGQDIIITADDWTAANVQNSDLNSLNYIRIGGRQTDKAPEIYAE